jgi:hypothetical protein
MASRARRCRVAHSHWKFVSDKVVHRRSDFPAPHGDDGSRLRGNAAPADCSGVQKQRPAYFLEERHVCVPEQHYVGIHAHREKLKRSPACRNNVAHVKSDPFVARVEHFWEREIEWVRISAYGMDGCDQLKLSNYLRLADITRVKDAIYTLEEGEHCPI